MLIANAIQDSAAKWCRYGYIYYSRYSNGATTVQEVGNPACEENGKHGGTRTGKGGGIFIKEKGVFEGNTHSIQDTIILEQIALDV